MQTQKKRSVYFERAQIANSNKEHAKLTDSRLMPQAIRRMSTSRYNHKLDAQ